ncbi:MAG: tyrosine-type recombinase/integrase [Methylotetracoccus sp.]
MLSDLAIRNVKPKDRPFKLHDTAGLYLLVNQAGRYWRLDYRFEGKRKTLALGVYPQIGLKEARERRDDARRLLSQNVDPGAERKAKKAANTTAGETFEVIAREWYGKFSPAWSISHSERIRDRLAADVFPWIGARPISAVTAPELLSVLRRIEARGALETARRVKQFCGMVFRYAVATGRADADPSASLKGAIPPPKAGHFASVTEPKRVGGLLRAIESYQGSPITRSALKLAPLLFVRPGELREAEWSEIDLQAAEWKIPAEKMKMRRPHIVPLARQAVDILSDLYPLTGSSRYVFPSERSHERPMSSNTLLASLRRLGYSKDEMTPHGFRHMASTLLNEQGWNRDAIERQLAHVERNAVRRAYNHAEHLPERRRMMQAWADYLDGLREGAMVVPFRATLVSPG